MRSDPGPPADGAWTMERLLDAEANGRRLGFLFFWSHRPPPSGTLGPHVLSQWFERPFDFDGQDCPTAEHAMMAAKARLFGDDDALAAIGRARSAGEAKALGRQVRGFDETTWEAHRLEIVTRVSIAKFGADPDLRGFLLATTGRVLVEASPQDRVWGIGLDRTDPDATRPSRWRGLNLLGFALMSARAELMTSQHGG